MLLLQRFHKADFSWHLRSAENAAAARCHGRMHSGRRFKISGAGGLPEDDRTWVAGKIVSSCPDLPENLRVRQRPVCKSQTHRQKYDASWVLMDSLCVLRRLSFECPRTASIEHDLALMYLGGSLSR